MKALLPLLLFICIGPIAFGETVTNINVTVHNGQIFIKWTNIPDCNEGFYYVYKSASPIIDASSLMASQLVGRVPFDFGFDRRFTMAIDDGNKYYLVTNDNVQIDPTENLFVLNATVEGAQYYYAVRCDFNHAGPNWDVVIGGNVTALKIKEHVQPIKSYLQKSGIFFAGNLSDEKMDAYIHYGSNIAVGIYPAMTNEQCLPYHFGIVKAGTPGANNAVYLKFHGGDGNFIDNAITTHISDAWKISFDDWIPAYNIDSTGTNTRWYGYHENFNVYEASIYDPPPTSGVVRAYTIGRVNWELSWILNKFNTPGSTTLDTSRMYLVGASQGCAAVLLFCLTQPSRFAAGSLTVPKYNLSAPDDDNPDCKFNDTGPPVRQNLVTFGEIAANLVTDVPITSGSNSYFHFYDLTNTNYTLHLRRNVSLPFLLAVNGKLDNVTCWQEKISVYDSIQSTRCGGVWEWDLRDHTSTFNTEWGSLDVRAMKRFSIHQSYPAFSYTSLDGNPGDANVDVPPYYNGDDVGAFHESFDWVDTSIVDSSYLWQIQLFTHQYELQSASLIPSVLPESATTDLTVRRAQKFKNFPSGTKLCWMNFYHGELIQSGVVHQLYNDTVPIPITVQKVKVFPDGNIFRIMLCDSIQPTNFLPPDLKLNDEGFGFIQQHGKPIEVYDLRGQKIPFAKFTANDQKEDGIYFVKLDISGLPIFFKWIKT